MIMYCSKQQMESQLITKLQNYWRPYEPKRNVKEYQEYLLYKFKSQASPTCAAAVDYEQ